MIQLAVAGGTGRLGSAIVSLAARDERFDVVAVLTGEGDPRLGEQIRVGAADVVVADRLGIPAEVVIDASTPAGTMDWLKVAERLEVPFVTGVTGHDTHQVDRLREVARVIPVVKAANFSVGMYALIRAAAMLARQLGGDYDIEMIETHHRYKADAPSGSALSILEAIRGASELFAAGNVVHGREGRSPERPQGQIGVHSVRMGETVGRHEVHFSGFGETVSIVHDVQSREPFAAGALNAAAWAIQQEPGLYSMEDVLRNGAP
ncbi:MAG: 4-hydroxy-tetrahydrodipicolinate reductase [Phycisphaerae bacterium]